MSAHVICPECQRKFRILDTAVGKRFRCPACQAIIPTDSAVLPEESEQSPSEPPQEEGITSAAADPPRSAGRRERWPERFESADDDRRRRKKPVRKGYSTGCIVGMVLGGVLLLLGVAGAGVGLVVYLALNRTIPEAEWQAFSPPNSGCTILMPGTPVPGSQTVNGLLINKYLIERKREKATFVVGFFDLRAASVTRDALES